jgi:hypothetical protein
MMANANHRNEDVKNAFDLAAIDADSQPRRAPSAEALSLDAQKRSIR